MGEPAEQEEFHFPSPCGKPCSITSIVAFEMTKLRREQDERWLEMQKNLSVLPSILAYAKETKDMMDTFKAVKGFATVISWMSTSAKVMIPIIALVTAIVAIVKRVI